MHCSSKSRFENYLWHESTINFTLIWSNKKKEKTMHYRLPVKTRLKRLSVKTFSPKLPERLVKEKAELCNSKSRLNSTQELKNLRHLGEDDEEGRVNGS